MVDGLFRNVLVNWAALCLILVCVNRRQPILSSALPTSSTLPADNDSLPVSQSDTNPDNSSISSLSTSTDISNENVTELANPDEHQHILHVEIELTNTTRDHITTFNQSAHDNFTFVLVWNGSSIVPAPVSMTADRNVSSLLDNTNQTDPDQSRKSDTISRDDSTETTIKNGIFESTFSGSSAVTEESLSNWTGSSVSTASTTANITDLVDVATRRQFCKLSIPDPEDKPHCTWKSNIGQQMDFFPSHIHVSLCIALVEKLEQCQVLCESAHDQCQGFDYCAPCVDYNCRLFKEGPGGTSGFTLSNALAYVDFYQKIRCPNRNLVE